MKRRHLRLKQSTVTNLSTIARAFSRFLSILSSVGSLSAVWPILISPSPLYCLLWQGWISILILFNHLSFKNPYWIRERERERKEKTYRRIFISASLHMNSHVPPFSLFTFQLSLSALNDLLSNLRRTCTHKNSYSNAYNIYPYGHLSFLPTRSIFHPSDAMMIQLSIYNSIFRKCSGSPTCEYDVHPVYTRWLRWPVSAYWRKNIAASFFFPQEKHDDDSIKTNCRVHYIPFFVVVVGIHQLIPPETLDRVPIFPTRYDGVCVCAPFLVTRNLIIAPVTKFYQHTLCAGWAAAAVDPHKEYKPVSGNTFLSKTRYIGWLFARSHSHGPALDAYSLSGWINVSSGKWRNEMIGYIFMKLTSRTSQGKK